MNNRVGVATFSGFTTAALGTQDFTITNSTVTATSCMLVTISALDASGNHAVIGKRGVTQVAGSFVVHMVNNSAVGALGAGDNVLISWFVMS